MAEYPNWFNPFAKPNFEKHLTDYKDKPDLRFLQLGVFTGDASLWLLDNVLTDSSSTLDDVDTWSGSDEEAHHTMDFDDVHKTYLDKVSSFQNVRSLKTSSLDYLLITPSDYYDFIYIDADHTAKAVIADAVLAWRTLKSGGIMAFDDYTWTNDKGKRHEPKEAINFFCWSYGEELTIIEANEQIWVKKS